MARDQQKGNQPASDQGSAVINNGPFNSNYGTANSNAADTPMYPPLLESQYENSGARAPYYYHSERSYGPRLGLIRGYHRQMYEPIPRKGPCCECSPEATRGTASSESCNWGVAFGCVLLIIGVIAVLMGFLVPQKPSSRHGQLTSEERHELHQINLFIDVFVISGLTVLSIGGLLISVALLLPLLRRKAEHHYDEPIRYFGSEVYVKAEDVPMTKSGKPSIDLGFHKDVVPADIALRKIQPEREKSEPIDLTAQPK